MEIKKKWKDLQDKLGEIRNEKLNSKVTGIYDVDLDTLRYTMWNPPSAWCRNYKTCFVELFLGMLHPRQKRVFK